MKSSLRVALCSSLALAVPVLPALAQPAVSHASAMFKATTVSLVAHGQVRVKPDMAIITLGVTTEAATAAQAMRENTSQMNEVVNTLKKQGVEERHIQTSSLNLHPQYTYRQDQPPVLRGYQAQNQVTIRVEALERLGRIVDAVVASGSNQISGISFGLVDPAAAEKAAREKAVQALREKAELYAKATGHRIVRLVNLAESGGYAPPAPRAMALFAQERAADVVTPVAAGELEVRVDISGVYELAQ